MEPTLLRTWVPIWVIIEVDPEAIELRVKRDLIQNGLIWSFWGLVVVSGILGFLGVTDLWERGSLLGLFRQHGRALGRR